MPSNGVYFRFRKIDTNNNLLARFDRACESNGLDRSEAIRQFMYDYVNKVEKKNNLPPIEHTEEIDTPVQDASVENDSSTDIVFDLKISKTSEYLKKINYTPSWRKK